MIVSAKIGIFRRTSALTVCFLAVCDPKQARRRFTRPLAFPFFVLHHTLVQFLQSPVKEIGAATVFPSLDGGIGVIALAVFES